MYTNQNGLYMSQRDEVIKTLKALNRPSTLSEVFDAMKDIISTWKTQTPKASVATYLTTTPCIKIDKSQNKSWTYTLEVSDCDVTRNDQDNSCSPDKNDSPNIHYGIYVIGINESVRLKCAGYIFKIGKSSKAYDRLPSYAKSLPFNPVEQIAFFEVPTQIENLEKLEADLRDYILTEPGVSRYYTLGQKEWLQVLNVDFENKRELSHFILKIQTKLKQLIEETLESNSQN